MYDSAAEFLRSERKEAYTQLLADEQALQQASRIYWRMLFSDADGDNVPAHATPEQLDAQAKVITDAASKFNVSASRVELVGSSEVAARLVEVREAHTHIENLLTFRGEMEPKDLDDLEAETRDVFREIEVDMPVLIQLAKVDMGNP